MHSRIHRGGLVSWMCFLIGEYIFQLKQPNSLSSCSVCVYDKTDLQYVWLGVCFHVRSRMPALSLWKLFCAPTMLTIALPNARLYWGNGACNGPLYCCVLYINCSCRQHLTQTVCLLFVHNTVSSSSACPACWGACCTSFVNWVLIAKVLLCMTWAIDKINYTFSHTNCRAEALALSPGHSTSSNWSLEVHKYEGRAREIWSCAVTSGSPLSTWCHRTWPDLPGLLFRICILQAIKYWRWEQPGNEARAVLFNGRTCILWLKEWLILHH